MLILLSIALTFGAVVVARIYFFFAYTMGNAKHGTMTAGGQMYAKYNFNVNATVAPPPPRLSFWGWATGSKRSGSAPKFDKASSDSYGYFTDVSNEEWKRSKEETMLVIDAQDGVMGRTSYLLTESGANIKSGQWWIDNWRVNFRCPRVEMAGGGKWLCDPSRMVSLGREARMQESRLRKQKMKKKKRMKESELLGTENDECLIYVSGGSDLAFAHDFLDHSLAAAKLLASAEETGGGGGGGRRRLDRIVPLDGNANEEAGGRGRDPWAETANAPLDGSGIGEAAAGADGAPPPPCEVHVFSPSARDVQGRDGLFVHNWGFRPSGKGGMGLASPSAGAPSSGIAFKTIRETIDELRHSGRIISALVLDCEGCEWDMYGDILAVQEKDSKGGPVMVRQVVMQMHGTPYVANELFLAMQEGGYVIYDREDASGDGEVYDYSWLKLSPSFFNWKT